MDNSKAQKEIVLLQVLYLFIIPILLLYFKILPSNLRFVMILGVTLVLLGVVHRAKWTHTDVGINKDFMKDIVPYSLFTVGGVLFIVWLAQVVPHNPFLKWDDNIRFLLLFIPLSVLQEIIFRGILMNMLGRVLTSPVFIILLNASIFAMMHVVYLNSIFVLPMTFIAGIGFAWMYYQYKNLPLISISHIILNFVAMTLGFFIIR